MHSLGMETVGQCGVCGAKSPLISHFLRVCLACIRAHPADALPVAADAHSTARLEFGLPESVPRSQDGAVVCPLCGNRCEMGEGERGFCGLRVNEGGRLRHLAGTQAKGLLRWYRDSLPTNCVADWVCSGHRNVGKHNLAVFYGACTADCLFCQNWHYRQVDVREANGTSAGELATQANSRTHCVCYFGGDPASQMPHALASAKRLADKGVTVCWETNGTANGSLMQSAVEISMRSGGCVKFDLKALNPSVYEALTGISNEQLLENLGQAIRCAADRPEPPLVVVSTLLVPGYVDAEEVRQIAGLVASLDPDTPYSLLGFGPSFFMSDLPHTSVDHAREAEDAARAAGLTRVRVGNRHLLSRDY